MEERSEDILRFRKKRAARLRRQNNAVASTRALPPEVLSLIFSYARGDPISNPTCQQDLVRLGHICSKWRNILLLVPRLWSRFTLTIKLQSGKQHGLQLLELYLNNTRDSPFSLCISFPRVYPAYNGLAGQIFQALQRHVSKVHTLKIECVPWAWVPWLSWFSSVGALEISNVVMPPAPDVSLSFIRFTRLYRLELSGSPCLRGVQLPWTQITSLTLKSMPIDLCMSLLLQCPNLTEFHTLSSRRRIENFALMPQIPDHTIQVEQLEHLSWSYEPDSTCSSYYDRLQFPSLHSLCWYSPSYRRAPSATGELYALRSLATRFPPTISQIRLFCVGSWPNDLTELLFDNSKNLQIIHFFKCSYSFVIDALPLLNRTDAQGRHIFPKLVEILIQDPEARSPNSSSRVLLEAELASRVTQMVRARDPNKTKDFSLQLVQTSGLTSKEMREAYISLKRDGHAFNVWVDTARVNSFQCVLDRERRVKAKEEIPFVDSESQLVQDLEDSGSWIVQR